MENETKTLKSGASLYITLAPFQEGHKLFKVVTRLMASMDAQTVLNERLVLKILSSEEVEQALWPCMARATYDGVKITPELFESAKIRCDFLTIATDVLNFNLAPFFPNLVSLSTVPLEENTENLK